MKHWNPGDVVIVRDPCETRGSRTYVELTGDSVANVPGWPYIVLEDNADRVVLYLPEGTKLWRWNIVEQRFREPRVSVGDSVRFLFEDKKYAVDLFFETGSGPAPWVKYLFLGEEPPPYRAPRIQPPTSAVIGDVRFYGWKVDMVAPLRRTKLGFDVADEVLDIVVWPDRSYCWKDEDQMDRLVGLGVYTEAEADELKAARQEVVTLIESGAPPFDDVWPLWRRPENLNVPIAPEGWQYLPLGHSEWGDLHTTSLSRRPGEA